MHVIKMVAILYLAEKNDLRGYGWGGGRRAWNNTVLVSLSRLPVILYFGIYCNVDLIYYTPHHTKIVQYLGTDICDWKKD